MGTAGVVRIFLLIDMIGLALLALVYLRQRRLSPSSYCIWGMLAVLVPVLGPFLVIANRPGAWNPDFSIQEDLQRAADLLKRLLPAPPAGKKTMRTLDRARARRARKRRIHS